MDRNCDVIGYPVEERRVLFGKCRKGPEFQHPFEGVFITERQSSDVLRHSLGRTADKTDAIVRDIVDHDPFSFLCRLPGDAFPD